MKISIRPVLNVLSFLIQFDVTNLVQMSNSPDNQNCYTELTKLIDDKHNQYFEFAFNESPEIEDNPKYINFSAEVTSQSPYIIPPHFNGIEKKNPMCTLSMKIFLRRKTREFIQTGLRKIHNISYYLLTYKGLEFIGYQLQINKWRITY